MQDSGQIEVIFSPFFHPIMPLLIDTKSAKVSTPELPLPFDYFLLRRCRKAAFPWKRIL